MKIKNTTIYFWYFIFTIILCIYNLNINVWSNSNELIFTNTPIYPFFWFTSGFMLINYYFENKTKTSGNLKNVWEYSRQIISSFFFIILSGILLTFVIFSIVNNSSFIEVINYFFSNIFEFLGLGSLNINNNISTTIFSNSVSGYNMLFSYPLLTFSGIIISSFILYYLLSNKEQAFPVIGVSIIIVIILLNNAGLLLLDNVFIKSMIGMILGMLLYYPINYLNNIELKEYSKIILSFTHMLLVLFLCYIFLNNVSFSYYIIYLLIYLFTFIILLNVDYISVLYNKSKFCEKIGKLSLYHVSCYIAISYLLLHLYPKMNYVTSIIFNILFGLCFAFILMYIDDYVITPLFRNKVIKKVKKK